MVKSVNAKTSFTSSNYYDFGNNESKPNFESLNTYNLSVQTGKLTTSLGLGASTKFNTGSFFEERTTTPAAEAKLKYNICNNLNTQARFRKIGNTEQYRLTFGGSYNFDKRNSIYSSVHLTTKHSNQEWSTNGGGWLGYTHNFDKCSISAEFQQNVPLNREKDSSKLKKIEQSDSMVNLILTVPFKK